MAKAKNMVVEGDYKGRQVGSAGNMVYLIMGFGKPLYIDASTVSAYASLSEDHQKSATSSVARGLVGGALLGPVGLIAGGVSGKTNGIYQVSINFKDGKQSVVEVDNKLYKLLMQKLALIKPEEPAQGTTNADSTANFSAADEILKYKQLLDSGIISQEEFDKKKQQLLDL